MGTLYIAYNCTAINRKNAGDVINISSTNGLNGAATFSTTNSVDISGGVPVGAGGTVEGSFGSSMTSSIEKGITLKGPPAGYSSRQYYMTRFKDYGTFKLNEKNILTGNVTTYNKSYSKPSSQDPFVDWSRDIK